MAMRGAVAVVPRDNYRVSDEAPSWGTLAAQARSAAQVLGWDEAAWQAGTAPSTCA